MAENPAPKPLIPLPGSSSTLWWWLVTALAAALFLGLGSLQLLGLMAQPIALFSLGIALAFALAPLVERLAKRIHRVLAVMLVFSLILLAFVAISLLIVPPLVGELPAVAQRLPNFIERLQSMIRLGNIGGQEAFATSILGQLGAFAGAIARAPLIILTSFIDLLLIFFVAIYWLISLPALKTFLLGMVPEGSRPSMAKILHRMGSAMGGYIRGTAINGLVMGVLVYIGLLVIRVDFPLGLAVLTGMLEFIPVLGPLIAGSLIVATALLQSPSQALAAGIYMLVMQQLEGHILVPNIMRSQTEMSSLLVLMALFVGNHIGGLLGGLAAVPLVAVLQVLVKEVIAPAIRRQTGAVSGTHILTEKDDAENAP